MTEVLAKPVELISEGRLGSGPAADGYSPDFYGPFLPAEDIRRPNPPERDVSPVKLEVGDYLVRTTGSEPFKPNHHARFILNALLAEAEGGIYTRTLSDKGFFPDSSSNKSRAVTATNNVRELENTLNASSHYRIIERTGVKYSLYIALAPEIEVVRLPDEDLREKISVQLPQNGNGTHTNGNGSHSNLGTGNSRGRSGATLPQTRDEFITIRSFEDQAYTGTLDFLDEKADDMPVIETAHDLRRAKNALASRAGQLQTPLQQERYALANSLIMEFSESEAKERPITTRFMTRPSGGEKIYPAGQEWRADAACTNTDQGIFFPQRGESAQPAKAVCGNCQIQDKCLEFALAKSIKFGIWGGTSEKERLRLRKQRRTAALEAKVFPEDSVADAR